MKRVTLDETDEVKCRIKLHDLLEFYLANPFDEDTHMQLNDGLTDTFDAMHSYFMERDI